MADEYLDISSDIIPVRGDYFPLAHDDVVMLSSQHAAQRDVERKKSMEFIDAMDRKRDRDLAYQHSLESLQRRRDEAQRQRELENRLPKLMEQINGVMADGETDELTKAERLTELSLTNPYLANSKGGAAVMGAAFKHLELQQARRAREEAERKTRRDKLKPYRDMGDVDKLTEAIDADGVREDWEVEDLEMTQYRVEKVKEQQENEAFRKEHSAIITKKYNRYTGMRDALDKLTDVTGGEGEFVMPDRGGDKEDKKDKKDKEPTKIPTNLKPSSRRRVIQIIAEIDGVPASRVRELNLSDEELIDAAYNGVNTRIGEVEKDLYPRLDRSRQEGAQQNRDQMANQFGN